jgi:hypothetical protein
MFSFSSLLSLLANAPTVIAAAQTGITDIESLLQQPAVQDLEQLFASLFTTTTTPGAAAVVEPISPTPGTVAAHPTGR